MPNLPKYDIEGLAKYLYQNKREALDQPELVTELYGQELRLAVHDDEFVWPVADGVRKRIETTSIEQIEEQLSADHIDSWRRQRDTVLTGPVVSLNNAATALIPILTDRPTITISVWRDLDLDLDRLERTLRKQAREKLHELQQIGRLPEEKASFYELADAFGFQRDESKKRQFFWISHTSEHSRDSGQPGVISKPMYGGKNGDAAIDDWALLEELRQGDVVLSRAGQTFVSLNIVLGECETGRHPFNSKPDHYVVPAYYFEFERPLPLEEAPESSVGSHSDWSWRFANESSKEQIEELWTLFREYFPQVEGDVEGFDAYLERLEATALEEGLPLPFEVPRNKAPEVTRTKTKPKHPHNLILYGPPGTGKTYSTKERALRICGVSVTADSPQERREQINAEFDSLRESGRVDFVTFHQSFGYEEFVEGIRPVMQDAEVTPSTIETKSRETNSSPEYQVVAGVFKKMADAARQRASEAKASDAHVLVIDEINRGNISKIFGELITLLEPDKRLGERDALEVRLPYSGKLFGVPSNLYVIGTMNTADRSIALLDSALRRRFVFQEMMPKVSVLRDVLSRRLEADPSGLDSVPISPDEWIEFVVEVFCAINHRVRILYDRDHQLGHTYLLDAIGPERLQEALAAQVVPLLQEYFYGSWEQLAAALGCPYRDGAPSRSDLTAGDRLIVRSTGVNEALFDGVDDVDPSRVAAFELCEDFKAGKLQAADALEYSVNILPKESRDRWRRKMELAPQSTTLASEMEGA